MIRRLLNGLKGGGGARRGGHGRRGHGGGGGSSGAKVGSMVQRYLRRRR